MTNYVLFVVLSKEMYNKSTTVGMCIWFKDGRCFWRKSAAVFTESRDYTRLVNNTGE